MSSPAATASRVSSKLPLLEKIGYGAGDTASNLVFHSVNVFLFAFYVDVWKLDAGAVGTLFLFTRLWDAINDPMMGMIADRTNSRWGRYRGYLLWMAIPFGLCSFITFAGPDLEGQMKLTYAVLTYLALGMIYTAINVPYSALMGVMTPDADQRTSLATFRFVGAFSAQLLVSIGVLPLIRELGQGDALAGYRATFAIFSVLAVGLFLFSFATTRERLKPELEETSSIGGDLSSLARNTAWLVMVVAGVLTLANVMIRASVTVLFFKYYVGDDNQPFIWFLDKTTLMLSSGAVAFICGIFFTGFLAKRFGKKESLVALTVLNSFTVIGFFFIPADAYWTMIAINMLGNFIAGPTPALVWAMYTDVADYGEWKFRRRTTGLVFSSAMFAQKFGGALGSAIAGWLLAWYGFVPDAPQSDETLFGIRVLFCLLPGALALANGGVVAFYPLTDAQNATIKAELEVRRAAKEALPSAA